MTDFLIIELVLFESCSLWGDIALNRLKDILYSNM